MGGLQEMSRILEHHLSEELSAIEQEVARYERARMKIDGKIEGLWHGARTLLISVHSSLVSPR
jgi:hypothetical protein